MKDYSRSVVLLLEEVPKEVPGAGVDRAASEMH